VTTAADTVAVTIAARNYLARAKAWVRSLARHHPELRAVVVLCDEPDAETTELGAGLECVGARALGIPGYTGLAFRSNVLELCAAVKPFAIARLLDGGARKVLYFDPDVLVCARLDEIVERMDRCQILVTPHLLEPPAEVESGVERAVLFAGVHNLGFLGVRAGDDARAMLDWWGRRLLRFCRASPGEGLYADQRWLDLVHGYWEGIEVFRHPGANVAHWNVDRRRLVESGEGGYRVATAAGEAPLLFFHFSGFDPRRPELLSAHGPRVALAERPDLAPLVGSYLRELEGCGEERCRRAPSAYDRFSNGEPVSPALRDLLRAADPDGSIFTDPFDAESPSGFHAFLRRPDDSPDGGGLSRLAIGIWRHRPDVQRVFPDPRGSDRAGYLLWLHQYGAREHDLPASLLGTGGGATLP
jgi:hypothetical protein